MEANLQEAHNLIAALSARGVYLKLRGNRLWVLPTTAYNLLPSDERAAIARLRQALKTIVRDGLQPTHIETPLPVAAPQQKPNAVAEEQSGEEPTPEMWVRGVRIEERHVIDTLASLGDHYLDAYAMGRLTKLEAYGMAARRERQRQEFPGRYYR